MCLCEMCVLYSVNTVFFQCNKLIIELFVGPSLKPTVAYLHAYLHVCSGASSRGSHMTNGTLVR